MESKNSQPSHINTDATSLDAPNSLRCAAINVNSLISLSKRYDLLNFINEHNLDIVCVGETKLTRRYNPQYKNYTLFRTDRPASQRGGGTALLIKDTIAAELVTFPSSARNEILEYTIAKLPLGPKNLFVISIYVNNLTKVKFIDELEQLFHALDLGSDRNLFIILGDFNSRHTAWGHRVISGKGAMLKKWEADHAFAYNAEIIASSTPTFPSTKSFLDLCIKDKRIQIDNLINGKTQTLNYNSDHLAILCYISL